MDWFEKLVGFREGPYDETRARLHVEGTSLHSRVNGASYGIGTLELISLQALRERAATAPRRGRTAVKLVVGDVRQLHRQAENAGALFQVASQFNLLEMVSPEVTPEDGVTGYEFDRTQGPACALAAGAATLYRNYFVPVDGAEGQTAQRQLDGLADLGARLSAALDRPVADLWSMQNGYALATAQGLAAISAYVQSLAAPARDALRGALRIGLHHDVEVTEAPGPHRPLVTQAFCSALPVAYSGLPARQWRPFACLVLEAAYEATMWAAVASAAAGRSNRVYLTLLGGGAFGNDTAWILSALSRSLHLVSDCGLDVRIVSYGPPSADLAAMVDAFR